MNGRNMLLVSDVRAQLRDICVKVILCNMTFLPLLALYLFCPQMVSLSQMPAEGNAFIISIPSLSADELGTDSVS